ncbi:hypothetical protein A0H81_00263 [Grifola frondosa]|uniref:Uncharacterized protein n=1 Tax=Grifola frondosa TaxID=5627 RepID=A0A1C7MRQ2_GRIFR|nr:hypothetical protein A0H81_00263 [Grifola frondosa]
MSQIKNIISIYFEGSAAASAAHAANCTRKSIMGKRSRAASTRIANLRRKKRNTDANKENIGEPEASVQHEKHSTDIDVGLQAGNTCARPKSLDTTGIDCARIHDTSLSQSEAPVTQTPSPSCSFGDQQSHALCPDSVLPSGADAEDELEPTPLEDPELYDDDAELTAELYTSPSSSAAIAALTDVSEILHLKRKSGIGHNPFEGDELLRRRLSMIKMLLQFYTHAIDPLPWITASLRTARGFGVGAYGARKMRQWAHSFIEDRENLPINLYGIWNVSLLQKGGLAQEIHLHLQSIGKYVQAIDIVHFLDTPDIKTRYSLKKTISLATAQRWMHVMDYRWKKTPTGQYVDGHKHEDVVAYRQNIFLPTIAELEWNLRVWKDGLEEITSDEPRPRNRHTIIWFHDESTFYANDDSTNLLDYGWLRSPNGEVAAQKLFKAGKARDGYFTNDSVLDHATDAMDICDEWYPHENHVFSYDNATTHLKRPDDALSAHYMPKLPTMPGRPVFMVSRDVKGPDGKPVYGPDGKKLKERVHMADGRFADGTAQPLYFPIGHKCTGDHKGMALILQERGFVNAPQLRAECPKFQCPKDAVDPCCCRQLLYNQPDFETVETNLETHCKARGYQVIFLPKFHCELNFIEQCWGRAKRYYREYPASSKEADLERNVIRALDSVELASMWRYAMCSRRFMDAYRRGLNGKQAAWAARKYRGHRVLPNSIIHELLDAGM